ncbi:MAG: hypothetical protein M3Y20_08415 [Actinomycetota bacterium]|nr:hypothetical protein [Actinomycetota bacterium]
MLADERGKARPVLVLAAG